MNNSVTSKKEILDISREIVISEGLQAINIRRVAKECNIAVGSLYNYFTSKDDLLLSVTKNIWTDIFHMTNCKSDFLSFIDAVLWIYESLNKGNEKYNNFLIEHSSLFINTNKESGKAAMDESLDHIKFNLIEILKNDSNIDLSKFNNNFSIEKYVKFIISNILTIILNKDNSIEFLIELIKKTIYYN